MAIVISDRVKETSLTVGTGTLALNGAFTGFQSFLSGVGDGNKTYYAIENDSRFEVGIGTYTQSTNTISRDTILQSSNSNAHIALTGVSRVFCTLPASKAVLLDETGNITFTDNSTFDSLTANTVTVSNLADLSNVNISGSVVISGDLLFNPTDQNDVFTMQRTSAGNFFHAYVDDIFDRTIGLYTDGSSSPVWKLGLKTSPSDASVAPDHGYIHGQDGDFRIIADATNHVAISNAGGFVVTHQTNDILKSSSVTGIHIDSNASAFPALTVNGGALLSANIQQWANSAGTVLSAVDNTGNFAVGKTTADYQLDVNGSGKFGQVYLTTGIIFSDGTTQTTASALGVDYGPRIANNTSSGVADSGYFEARINSLSTADYSADILANSQSGVAISGWVDSTFVKTDTNTTYTAGSGMELVGTVFNFVNSGQILANSSSGVAISGWADSTFIKTDTNTTYTAGSGMSLVGTTFNWTQSGIPIANSGYFETKIASLADNDTTYTAGSGLELVGTVFNFVDSGHIVANSASGVAISGIAAYASGVVAGGTPTFANINVGQYIYHDSDADTYINFTDDDIKIHVGGISMLDFTEGDTDTIIFNETAENIDVRIEGEADANLFFTDASTSKVGIGTDAPAGKLHIRDPTNPPQIRFEDAGGGTQTAKIIFDQAGNNSLVLSTQYQSASDLNLIQFAPANNVAMTLRGGTGSSDGFVGIGTSTPDYTLDVAGSGSFEGLIVDKAIKTKIQTEVDAATITYNLNDSNTFMTTLKTDGRTLAVSNAASGQKFMIRLLQDSTGSRTVNWFSNIAWSEGGTTPTLTTTADKADLFGFLCTSGSPGGAYNPYFDGFIIGQNI